MAGQQDRPLTVEKANNDLAQRLERLPPGHPSSPYNDDGTRKPPVARPADRELPLPDEFSDESDPGPRDAEEPGQRPLDTSTPTQERSPSPEPSGRDRAGQEVREGEADVGEAPQADAQEIEARASGQPGPEAASPDSRSWWEALPNFREQWERHKERWPQEERPPVDRSADEPGSWRGDSGRELSPRENAHVDAACDRIVNSEPRITERVEATERVSAGRLVGKEFCRKEPDSLKEKVAAAREGASNADLDHILADIHDAVRYTLEYSHDDYTEGVLSDVGWLKAQGFDLIRLKNFWNDVEYKGINSQWHDTETGQTFEMQFHTPVSFEAKQLTHGAYERIRNPQTTEAESGELHNYQREVSSMIPMPIGASDIPEHP